MMGLRLEMFDPPRPKIYVCIKCGRRTEYHENQFDIPVCCDRGPWGTETSQAAPAKRTRIE